MMMMCEMLAPSAMQNVVIDTRVWERDGMLCGDDNDDYDNATMAGDWGEGERNETKECKCRM
jgi:hypothetical protein